MNKLDCRRCGTAIPLPTGETLSPSTVVTCPGCGARYARRAGGQTAATLAPRPSALSTPHGATQVLGARQTELLFRPGDLVGERYRVRRFIARGGMGEVYEAEDIELRQAVALKTVHPRDATQEVAIERFKREIYLARKVTHPNVCRIYDVGFHARDADTPVIFLTMELLEGETLAHRIRRQGALSIGESLPIVRQMVAALGAAHAAGVIHRDFKSENVFLVPAGDNPRVVVTDFGVARGTEQDQFAAQVTMADAAVGTPAYMAPEQIEGGYLTAAIDQYALGVVLFEMVTGELPFAGDTPLATAVKRLTQAPPSPDELKPGLDPQWVQVIRRCLARYPEERYEAVLDVDRALTGEHVELAGAKGAPGGVSAVPAVREPEPSREPATPAVDPRRRRQRRWLAVVSVLLLLAVAQAVVRIRRSLDSPLGEGGGIRKAVAVVPFRNLAQRSEFEWLSIALAEMVASELRAGEGLRAVSGDDVARARVDLGLSETDQPTSQVIGVLRSRLGTEFVVLGSYTVLGDGDTASVRLAVRLEDAAHGETLGEAVETGGQKELFGLVSALGSKLREWLGAAGHRDRGDAAGSAPATPRAAQLYSEGLLQLRNFQPSTARELLEQAVAAEPSHPMPHAALAQAWAALGFEQKAQVEAARALDLSAGLPPEDRLVIEGLAAELTRDWPRAQETYGRLWSAFPDALDYGLKLARVQIDGGRASEALLTIGALRGLPEPDRSHPRIELAEAAAASATSNFTLQRDAAKRAAARAEALDAPLLVAEARLREAEALRRLGDAAGARSASEAARALYVTAGDRSGEASALSVAAGALFDQGELGDALTTNESALARYREVGDRGGVARSLNSLAVLARNFGDLAKARALYSKALGVLAEVGDARGTAYTRNNLAAATAEEGRLGEAHREVSEALTVFQQLDDPSGAADALLNLGAIERQTGSLADARLHLEEALAKKRELGQRAGEAAAMAALGALALDRGEISEARASLETASEAARATGNKAVLANALATLAEVELESDSLDRAAALAGESLAVRRELGRQGKVDESRLLAARIALESGQARSSLLDLEALVAESGKGRSPDLSAEVEFMLARALAASGRVDLARSALARGWTGSSRSESLRVRLQGTLAALATEVAGARPIAGPLDPASASTLAAEKELRVLALELELLQIRNTRGRSNQGVAALQRIAAEASARGLKRVARVAEQASSSS